jgi:hypothetical protein
VAGEGRGPHRGGDLRYALHHWPPAHLAARREAETDQPEASQPEPAEIQMLDITETGDIMPSGESVFTGRRTAA